MKSAIGEGMTRKDHDALSNQVRQRRFLIFYVLSVCLRLRVCNDRDSDSSVAVQTQEGYMRKA